MSPRAFEDAIAELFRRDVFDVVQTPYVNDHGRDAIAKKDGRTFLIECKRYDRKRAVGRRDLQIFYAAVVEARAYRGFFVTTARCKRTALDFVNGKPIELIDGDQLVVMMQRAYTQQNSHTTYNAMCRECGAVVARDLLRPGASVYCANGHAVPASISFDSLRPSDTRGVKEVIKYGPALDGNMYDSLLEAQQVSVSALVDMGLTVEEAEARLGIG